MSESLQKYEAGFSLDKPARALELADVLKKYITDNKLSTVIQGKEYVNVEGWQFAGGMLGIFPVVQSVTDESTDEYTRFRAEVKLIDQNGIERGCGIAICDNHEPGKTRFAPYAICSMAQTRAIGKAYRNLLAWIVRAAGFEPTPSEEMDAVKAQSHKYGGRPEDYPMDVFKKHTGKRIGDFTHSEIQVLVDWCKDRRKPIYEEFIVQGTKYYEAYGSSGIEDFLDNKNKPVPF